MNQTEIINIFTKKTLGLTFVLSAAALAFAQEKVGISGSVVNKSNQPVPYASVTFSNKANKQLSDATLTDEKGQYKLDITPGEYDISVEAIDYKKSVVTKQITAAGNIGAFSIDPEASATNMKTGEIQGVTITAASTKPYKVELDKRTYDPSQDIVSKGGNLQDVLSNVPSVSVDTDGTVSMRGSSNVRFLINGKPSALLGIDDGANALQSIPADQIERIEVITNPSSKYDAEGTTGIINIVLKRQKKEGVQGNLQLNTGLPDNHSALLNLSWQTKKIDWTASGGVGYRSYPAEGGGITKYSGDTTFYFSRDREQMRRGPVYNAQIGADIFVDSTNTVNISTSFFKRVSPNFATLKYEDLNELQQVQKTTIRTEDEHEIKQNIELNVGHTKKFKKPGMKWVTDVNAYNNIPLNI